MDITIFAVALLSSQLASTPTPGQTLEQAVPAISEDWAKPEHQRATIVQIAGEYIAEDRAKATEVPRRYEADSIRGDKYESFAAEFSEAKVPGCLRPDGLKRQSTYIFSGLFAMPFILVAKARGKCL